VATAAAVDMRSRHKWCHAGRVREVVYGIGWR
jgi:hypothetical protein